MGTKYIWQIKSIGFAPESAYGTANDTDGDFAYLKAEFAPPTLTRAIQDFKAATGQTAGYDTPAIGSKHGTSFSVKFPIRTFKSGYSASGDSIGSTDTLAPEFLLLCAALGSNAGAVATATDLRQGKHLQVQPYAAADVASYGAGPPATVGVQNTHGANYSVGELLYTGSGITDQTPCRGFIKTISGDTLTLFEAPGAVAQANDNVYQTGTGYLSDQQMIPLTFRVLGDSAAMKFSFAGCIATSVKLHLKAGDTPTCEIGFVATAWKDYGSGGPGLQVPASFGRIQPILGTNLGRVTFGDAGSGVATDLANLEIDIAYTVAPIPSHTATQGVSAVIVTERKVKVTCEVPYDTTASYNSGSPIWDQIFEAGSSKSLAVYVGGSVGQTLALLLPQVHLEAQPGLKDENGLIYHSLQFRPSTYTSDGAAGLAANTTAADSLLRIACG